LSQDSREPMGLSHPDMTPQLAEEELPGGPRVDWMLLLQLRELAMTHPLLATASAVFKQIHDSADQQLRDAQRGHV